MSSEDRIDMSDELMEVDMDLNDKFIAECAEEARRRKRALPEEDNIRSTAQIQADAQIREAEAAKIRMMGTPGTSNLMHDQFNGFTAKQHSSVVDENYMMIGSHIDSSLRDKIRRGEVCRFCKTPA